MDERGRVGTAYVIGGWGKNDGVVVEAFDLGGNQDLEILERKAAQWSNAGLAALTTRPEIGHGGADRRYDAYARNDDTACYARFGHLSHVSVF